MSFALRTAWAARKGTCIPATAPKPARIWYPIHFPAPVSTPNVNIIPDPIAKIAAPAHMNGT